MGKFVTLNSKNLKPLRQIDSCFVSYNVEMTEVTGGTFWSAYTDAQIDGTEEFAAVLDWRNMRNLQQWFEPIDTRNERLIKLAKELGTAWVRVSGTWATKTYYDFDGHTNGNVPEGYQNLLTKEQWISLLDFVKAVGGKLMVSVANCPGNHKAEEPWNTEQAKLLFDFSKNYGVPILAAEFTNEPNLLAVSGLPQGYTAENHARDMDIFAKFIRENYPECKVVGPSTSGDLPDYISDKITQNLGKENGGVDISSAMQMLSTDALIGNCKETLDVFSYHLYNGVSERGAGMGGHWRYDQILTEDYLSIAGMAANYYAEVAKKYCPDGQIWITESGDAGCGGNTWSSTYAEVPRTLNELGAIASVMDGIIFHNTLASSDYGYLQHGTFEPRPSYFAVLLWNRIMGRTVYDCGEVSEGAHIYAHSRKDGKEGVAYLIINNSEESTTLQLPKEADVYMLSGEEKLRSRIMTLNGKRLVLGENDTLPDLTPEKVQAGTLEIPSANCAFIVL